MNDPDDDLIHPWLVLPVIVATLTVAIVLIAFAVRVVVLFVAWLWRAMP